MFNKRDLVYLLKSKIEMDGFTFSEEEQGVSWENKQSDKSLNLYIGFSGSADRFNLQHPFACVSFYAIEDKIKSLIIPPSFTYNKYTCRALLDGRLYDLGLRDVSISSELAFNFCLEILHSFLLEIQEFFHSMKSLSVILNKLNELEPKDQVEYLGQPFPFRKIALLFYTDFNEYKEYSNKVKTFYETSKSPLLNATLDLIKNLETSSRI